MSRFGSLIGGAAKLVDPLHLVTAKDKSATLAYKGTLIVKKTNLLDVTNAHASIIDNVFDVLGQGVSLQLISSTSIQASINTGKTSKSAKIKTWFLAKGLLATDEIKYKVTFTVDVDFGVPGAFTIKNSHPNEFYLVSLTLEIPGGKVVEFPCNSWVYPASKYPTPRIFFSNQLYLPCETPAGLVDARKADLQALRGNGDGTRQDYERIYDYDVYNDLGKHRPVLGGSRDYPYPRRCRTGRKVVNGGEVTVGLAQCNYVPSDERFSATKNSIFLANGVKAISQGLIPVLKSFIPSNDKFKSFAEIKSLYHKGLDLSKVILAPLQIVGSPLNFIRELTNTHSLLKFPVPQVFKHNEKAWMSDEEFGRQMLGGANPMVIECLKAFPPSSNLDPAKYGPKTSAITEEHIACQLEGQSVFEALKQSKLFILNYFDAFMPYLEMINGQKDTFIYATRTVLYLRSDGTLKPVGIELCTLTSRQVLVPPTTRDVDWLWELAKAHVATNDSCYHQLISHWLRTHACIEPFILATSRQLSAMHPLNPFLKPHFRNTLTINAKARILLIKEEGVFERFFATGSVSAEFSSVAYKDWRLDEQGLPADLIKRGMATPDACSKHGLKLTIEDYPYATDGLEIWAALKEWTEAYVDAVYKNDSAVASDAELQAWWFEVVNVGHQDKKNESWWVKLDGKASLVEVLTTVTWVASAHHAAVNFGQYAYGGYMPNHPTKTHRPVPEKYSSEYNELLQNPEAWFLSAVSRKVEAVVVVALLEILSSHADDEEYLGKRAIKAWTSNEVALAAFDSFARKLQQIEADIQNRNMDNNLKNRTGPSNVPYTLLMPSSESGITGRGIPSSISI